MQDWIANSSVYGEGFVCDISVVPVTIVLKPFYELLPFSCDITSELSLENSLFIWAIACHGFAS